MRLSVCIITYNHEAFIEQAILSVLKQDVAFDYEIVVGEDCSTDATGKILQRLEALNANRLKIIYRHKNIGSRANFNDTLSHCRGEFIAFLEGDDFWTAREKLQRQVDFLDEHQDASFCFHRTRFLTMPAEAVEKVLPPIDPPALSPFSYFIQDSNPVALSSMVVRRRCLADLAIWLGEIKPGDWPLCLMLAKQGPAGYLPMEMSRYRVHAQGYWARMAPQLRVAMIVRMLSHIATLLAGHDKELVERRRAELADWWAGELICNESLPIEGAMSDLDGIGDYPLTRFLLRSTAEKARNIYQAQLWCARQLQASEANARTAKSEATDLSLRLDAKISEYEKTMRYPEVNASIRFRNWLANIR